MKLRPRDFIETREGLVFAVVSPLTEDGRAITCLRYVPHRDGRRKLGTLEAEAYLRRHHPQYLHYSRSLDSYVHGVPVAAVATHLCPRRRIQSLLQQQPHDPMERRLHSLLSLLADAGVPMAQLGVTGSLLIGQQHARSDLDLVVYDRSAFALARKTVRDLIGRGLLQDLDEAAWRDAHGRRNCDLELEEFLRHERRKGNKALIDTCKFDLALVADDGLSAPEPGWLKTGSATLQAQVTDASLAYDQPACYSIDHPSVSKIYSFTHTYAGQAASGEWIEASGSVEVSSAGCQRLIIGSSREAPGQYLRVLWDRSPGRF